MARGISKVFNYVAVGVDERARALDILDGLINGSVIQSADVIVSLATQVRDAILTGWT